MCTTAIAFLAAGIYLGVRTSSYDATSNILVAPLTGEESYFQGIPLIRESSDGSRPVQTATGLLSGPSIADITARGLGAGWTQAKVESAVQAQPRGESNIVAITAQADSPSQAAKVANSYATVALQLRRQALGPDFRREIELSEQTGNPERASLLRAAQTAGDPTLSVASRAQPPTAPSSVSTRVVLLVALVVGLLVGIGAILVIGLAEDTSEASSS